MRPKVYFILFCTIKILYKPILFSAALSCDTTKELRSLRLVNIAKQLEVQKLKRQLVCDIVDHCIEEPPNQFDSDIKRHQYMLLQDTMRSLKRYASIRVQLDAVIPPYSTHNTSNIIIAYLRKSMMKVAWVSSLNIGTLHTIISDPLLYEITNEGHCMILDERCGNIYKIDARTNDSDIIPYTERVPYHGIQYCCPFGGMRSHMMMRVGNPNESIYARLLHIGETSRFLRSIGLPQKLHQQDQIVTSTSSGNIVLVHEAATGNLVLYDIYQRDSSSCIAQDFSFVQEGIMTEDAAKIALFICRQRGFALKLIDGRAKQLIYEKFLDYPIRFIKMNTDEVQYISIKDLRQVTLATHTGEVLRSRLLEYQTSSESIQFATNRNGVYGFIEKCGSNVIISTSIASNKLLVRIPSNITSLINTYISTDGTKIGFSMKNRKEQAFLYIVSLIKKIPVSPTSPLSPLSKSKSFFDLRVQSRK